MRLLSATITAAAISALAALPAQAANCRHLPGQGAIDQYCEIIPSGAGARPDRTGGGGSASSLPARTRKALMAAGAEGRAVAALAQTSPAPQLSGGSAATGGAGAGGSGANAGTAAPGTASEPAAASTSTLHALVGDLDDTSGRGWLPWALLTIAAVAGITAWLRRGRSS
jgi:hypothetical protein